MHECTSLWRTACSLPRAKFGIKVRLQLAFGAVAIMTVVAAAVAIMSFSETERGFEQRVDPRSADDDRRAAPLGRLGRDLGGGRALCLGQDLRRPQADRRADRDRSRELDEIMDRLRVGQSECAAASRSPSRWRSG